MFLKSNFDLKPNKNQWVICFVQVLKTLEQRFVRILEMSLPLRIFPARMFERVNFLPEEFFF